MRRPADPAPRTPGAQAEDHLVRIALLSPYGGTNLGDAAIQEAAIRGIRSRLPNAVVSGIYLNPAETARRHGIRCFQITGFSLEFYANYAPAPTRDRAFDSRAAERDWRAALRQSLKTLPLIGPALRRTVIASRRVWSLRHEVVHIVRSYWFARAQNLIVVAGGGQLDDEWGGPWGHPYALFRWALLARLAGARFVVLSVGVCYLDSRLSRWFVRGALRLAAYRSYRDRGSEDLLGDMRFTRADPCVPDLAFALARKPAAVARLGARTGARRVGVSPIGFGNPALWPTDKAVVFERYAAELERFVRWLGDRGYEVVLFATGGVDRLVIAALQDALTDPAPSAAPPSWVRRASDDRLENLMGELEQVDLVVASRLHGVLLSHIAGKPVVAVSFDRKVDAHMAEVGQQRYCLNIHSVGHLALEETFSQLEREAPMARAQIESVIVQYHEAVEKQFDLLARLVTSRERPA